MPVNVILEAGVAQVVLDDPPLNILTRELMGSLREQLAALATERLLRAVVFRAAGRHFSAGASVQEHLPPEHEVMIPEFMATVEAVRRFPLPVVAAVRGRCLGGAFELVLGADVVLAGESAVFGVPEIHLGVFPPAACVLLPHRTSPALAAEMLFTGDPVDAEGAREAGLVRRVVPDDRVDDEALALAGRMARHSAAALRETKRVLRESPPDLDPALRRAAELYDRELMGTADAVEGLQAFVDKRTPRWSHQ